MEVVQDPTLGNQTTSTTDAIQGSASSSGNPRAYKSYGNRVHTTMFPNPKDGKSYKIIGRHSPMIAIEKILKHNSVRGYTGILNAGESGTGKSTWTKFLLHHLHLRKGSVVIKWFYKDQIAKFVDIVNSLQKGVDHIIVFDDASFSLENIGKEELLALEKTLTYIRHILKARVIVIFNIHYSKAIQKFFRATTQFRYLTTLSNEEIQSYEDLFGPYSKYKLRDFARMIDHLVMRGSCTFEISRWQNKYVTYQLYNPFGLLFASEGNEIRFSVYLADSCAICDTDFESKKIIDEKSMIDSLVKKYHKYRVATIARHYMHSVKGMNTLPTTETSLWKAFAELDRTNKIDWEKVDKIIKQDLMKQRGRSYVKKDDFDNMVDEIQSQRTDVVDTDTHDHDITKMPTPDAEDVLDDDARVFPADDPIPVRKQPPVDNKNNPFISDGNDMAYGF